MSGAGGHVSYSFSAHVSKDPATVPGEFAASLYSDDGQHGTAIVHNDFATYDKIWIPSTATHVTFVGDGEQITDYPSFITAFNEDVEVSLAPGAYAYTFTYADGQDTVSVECEIVVYTPQVPPVLLSGAPGEGDGGSLADKAKDALASVADAVGLGADLWWVPLAALAAIAAAAVAVTRRD
jgi:hypothetical protein